MTTQEKTNFWQNCLKDWSESNQNMETFCQEHNIEENNFVIGKEKSEKLLVKQNKRWLSHINVTPSPFLLAIPTTLCYYNSKKSFFGLWESCKKRTKGMTKTNFNIAISLTEQIAQYDMNAKMLVSRKSILSRILIHTIPDFYGMSPDEVEELIVGVPQVSTVPLESGMTNTPQTKQGEKVPGFNTTDYAYNEGYIFYDIIFYVKTLDGLSQIIVNVECQKDEPTKYHILNRATFYTSRMISSQKERDFVGEHYNDIQRVYSIWICMNEKECSLDHIHLVDDSLLGNRHWKGSMDLFNIIMIGIPNEIPKDDELHKLHRLLGAIFSSEATLEERKQILEQENHIQMNLELEEGIDSMCNLGQGVLERGLEQGKKQGEAQIVMLINYLISDGREEDVKKIVADEEYRKLLYTEYHIESK